MAITSVVQRPCYAKPGRILRLSFVTETYPPEVNGVAMTASRLVNGMLARGHHVQLIRPRQRADEDQRCEGALEIIPQPGLTIPWYRELKLGLPAGRALIRLWRSAPPDLAHIETEGPLGRAALRAAQRMGLPVVTGFHTNFHQYSRHYGLGLLARPIVAYLRRFHNRAALTLVPTAELASQLGAQGFNNLRVLSRGVDTRQFSPKRRDQGLRQSWGAGPADIVMLYVGRLAPEKNLELAIQAFKAAREVQPRTLFVLVGDGPMGSRLRAQYPRFVFCGMRRDEDLAAHYASGDMLLFPSLTETFGNVTLEAMASGLAVVAFDYAAARCHAANGQSGMLAPVGDNAAFIKAVRTLVRQPVTIRRLGQAARRAAEQCSWEQIHDALEAIFLELTVDRHEQVY